MKLLDALGYIALRASGSHGVFDVVAFGPTDVKAIQVKTGDPASVSALEEETIQNIRVPDNVTKQVWLWDKGSRQPRVREYR